MRTLIIAALVVLAGGLSASASVIRISGDLTYTSANAPGGPSVNLALDLISLNDPTVTGTFQILIGTSVGNEPGIQPGKQAFQEGGSAVTSISFSNGVEVEEGGAAFVPQPYPFSGTTVALLDNSGAQDQINLGLNFTTFQGGNGFTFDFFAPSGQMFTDPTDLTTLKDFGAFVTGGSLAISVCDQFDDPYFDTGGGKDLPADGFCGGAIWQVNYDVSNITTTFAAVPLPATGGLLLAALAGMGLVRKRWQSADRASDTN